MSYSSDENRFKSQFLKMLVRLSKEITMKDFKTLKFLSDLPESKLEGCTEVLDLFKALINSGGIEWDKTDILREMIESLDVPKLLSIIGELFVFNIYIIPVPF
jgi:hypothetical protein